MKTDTRLRNRQFLILLLCWLAYALAYFGRVNISVALPGLQGALSLNKSQVGLIGTVLFWVYGVGQLINGYIGDRVNSRVFIFIGLAVAGVANLVFGLADSFLVLALMWGLNGFFQSMLWGPISKTLSHWYEHKRLNRVAIAVSTSMVAGYLLAWGVGGQLLAMGGWRWVFLTPAIALLVFAPIWLLLARERPGECGLMLPDPGPAETAPAEPDAPVKKYTLFGVIKETKLWFVIAACLMQGLIKEGIGLWGPTFVSETHHMDMQSTTMLILFVPLMNFGGMTLAGWLNGILGRNEKLSSAILFGIATLSMFGLLWLGRYSIALALAFIGIASAAIYGVNTLLLGVLPLKYIRYNKVSSIAGFMDFCSYMAAAAATPLTGLLVTALGWNGAVWMWAAAAALGIGLLLLNWKKDKTAARKAAAV